MSPGARLTLYTKPGCHLCEAVEQVIARVRNKTPFELEVRNILDDAQSFAKYQHDVPVVLLDGREIARHRLSAAQLEDALRAAASMILVIMAKLPEPGKVKTRLLGALTAEQASQVHQVFLRHVARRLESSGEILVCFDPPDALQPMSRLLSMAPDRLLAQSSGDLGARLARAFRSIPADRVLFFGVDSPDVPQAAIDRAMALLKENDVVIGPCSDGGYWCLGLARSVDADALLRDVEWSSGRELEQTLQRARCMNYRTGLADRWEDVDRPDDLRRLVSRLRKSDNEADMRLLQDLMLILENTPLGGMS